jgi:hypothetical protein
MKKTEMKKPLPKLEVRTLDHHDLNKVTGGVISKPPATNGTSSFCHVDGTVDGD